MNDLKEKKKIIFRIETIAVGAVLFVYGFILYYINRGISCDEGFYLLGFLKNQELGAMITDFHAIVRAITPNAMQDNVMYFRYLRFGLGFISVLLFGLSSFYWLKNRIKTFKISCVLYVSLILLGGAMSFAYATPTISFDHLQHIFFCFAFVAFINADLVKSNIARVVNFLISGFFVMLAMANYLPSGILLFVVFIALIIILNFNKSALSRIAFLFVGILIGAFLYHIFVSPVDVLVKNIVFVLNSITNDESSSGLNIMSLIANTRLSAGNVIGSYDSLSLIFMMLFSIILFLLIQLPAFLIGYFSRKINIHSFIVAIAIVLVICSFFFLREIYFLRAFLYYLPVSFTLGIWLAEQKSLKNKLYYSDFLMFLIFTLLPFMGVFGTNQTIAIKIIIFMPFWMCLFLAMVNNLKISKKQRHLLILFVIGLYSIGYLVQGHFSTRTHSHYSIHRARYAMDFGVRYRNVTVSRFEKEYYRTFVETLDSIGFKVGDTALAFGEHLRGLYLIGGYFHGGLVFFITQYNIPTERARFIFLFRKGEELFKSQLKNSGWNFPEDYERIELGRMSEVFPEGDFNTVIYFIRE